MKLHSRSIARIVMPKLSTQELVQHYTSSTTSQIRSDHYLNFISTAKLDSSCKKSLTAFLYTWEDQLRLYEEVTPVNEHYPDPVKRRLLENAVSGNESMANIAITDRISVGRGQKPISYDYHMEALRDAAAYKDNPPQLRWDVTTTLDQSTERLTTQKWECMTPMRAT